MYCVLPPDLTSSSPRILSYLYLKIHEKEGPRWRSARFVDSEHIAAAVLLYVPPKTRFDSSGMGQAPGLLVSSSE